jgi:hypothetical protein
LLVQSEPQTDAVNDFRPELNNAARDVAMVRQFVLDLENAGIAGLHKTMLLGAGAGTFQPDWQSFITGFAAIPGLDMIDTHIYNLQPTANVEGEFAIAMKIADIAHEAGKGVSLCEFWFSKSSMAVGLTDHGDPLADTMVRDVFSFWTPLDVKFLNTVAKLANLKHFDYISGFGLYNWFALTDYDTIILPPVYPPKNASENSASDTLVRNRQFQLARQALAARQLSPTGEAYKTIIAKGPK